MEAIDDSSGSSSSKDERVEAVDLLEECWFFGNLLSTKARMVRCNSDLSSSKLRNESLEKKSASENSSPTMDLQSGNGVGHCNLLRSPSLPPCIGRKEEVLKQKSSSKMSKLTRQLSESKLHKKSSNKGTECKESNNRQIDLTGQRTRNLLRTPSLPPCIGREEDEFRVKDTKHKGSATTNRLTSFRPPTSNEDARHRYFSKMKTRKSLSDLESEEVQGFKDLGFTFDRKDINPNVVNILPGLRDQKGEESHEIEKVERPYLSEAWLVQNCTPPISNWVAKQSAQHMKEQIKFWARVVASNVH